MLDRVLDRDDAAFHGVEHGEKGVERGALAATGRAGEQDDAVGLRDEVADPALGHGGETEERKVEPVCARDKAEGDAFAADGRDGGDADVDRLAFHLEIDAAVPAACGVRRCRDWP